MAQDDVRAKQLDDTPAARRRQAVQREAAAEKDDVHTGTYELGVVQPVVKAETRVVHSGEHVADAV